MGKRIVTALLSALLAGALCTVSAEDAAQTRKFGFIGNRFVKTGQAQRRTGCGNPGSSTKELMKRARQRTFP